MSELKNTKLAILGAGNMGQALLAGALKAGVLPEHIRATTQDEAARERLIKEFGVTVADTNAQAVAGADLVVLAVKPYQVTEVIKEIALPVNGEQSGENPVDRVAPALARNTAIVSVAVGIDLKALSYGLPAEQPIIRAMPNTPAMVGQGITALSPSNAVSTDQLELASEVLAGSGTVIVVPEKFQAAVGAISGSGPAYVAYFIDALIEAGVHQGLPRDVATALVVGTFEGSAAMLRETGDHPAIAREKVTSPGGTTAAALAELDNSGVRAAIIRAVGAAIARTNEIAAAG